jgi:hypothetical protein
VSTGCTIVPIVGRLATFTSLTPMNGDRVRIECLLQGDVRLLEGIALIVKHAADHAGIPEKIRTELVSETLDACSKALASAAQTKQADGAILLRVDQFQDRVEVLIDCEGNGPDSLDAGDRGAARVALQGSGNGRPRTRLVRYCGALDSKPVE